MLMSRIFKWYTQEAPTGYVIHLLTSRWLNHAMTGNILVLHVELRITYTDVGCITHSFHFELNISSWCVEVQIRKYLELPLQFSFNKLKLPTVDYTNGLLSSLLSEPQSPHKNEFKSRGYRFSNLSRWGASHERRLSITRLRTSQSQYSTCTQTNHWFHLHNHHKSCRWLNCHSPPVHTSLRTQIGDVRTTSSHWV